MTRPSALPVKFESIPQELRERPRWVLWKYVHRAQPDGKKVWAKMPCAIDGRAASTNRPETWTTFDDVADTFILGGFDGLGYVLGDDVQGIDLDDCRNPETGELNELAQEALQKIDGYAEVSPSGTGIKLFSRTNLDGSRADKTAGVELYKDNRYFTVTGHQLNGHESLPALQQDVEWLVERVFGQPLLGVEPQGDAAERALALYREPLEGWDLERVAQEVLVHLDPGCGYDEWLRVGAALHHQGQGDEEWLAAWDEWSAGSGKWVEGYCSEKWKSFSTSRLTGAGAVTLASLLKKTKDQRVAVRREGRKALLDELMDAVAVCTDDRELQEKIAASAANSSELIDVERARLAKAIQLKAKELGAPVDAATVRGWVRCRVAVASVFAHLNEEGNPLCTLENLQVLLGRLGYTVRYNVIKKAIEILIPNTGFTRDNRDNAAIAMVYSECEKVRMPTKHVAQYLIALADANPYNPVATWVESAPWDGVSRLEEFYATVRSASGDEGLKKKLLRKWLVQAIAAAMSPDGIANQGILTFVGPQNIGKTTWFQRLAPEELDVILTGHTLDTRSKDSIFVALSFWLVELGEVDATMRKSDISALKSFITQPHDKIRRPYAATESAFGRRTAFGATVNDDQYLHDPTGNRRFWTIEVEGFDLGHRIDMQQLWAEVLYLWQSGEHWALDKSEVAELNAHNESFTAVDPVEERLAALFDQSTVGEWRWVTASEALMAVGVKEPTKAQSITAGRALKRLNGGQRKKSNGKVVFAVPGEDFLG